ncbi:hypothetical protein F5Y08DRAFT_261367 [Xylaria arbuscula]|nr:hypothetical protein F5Y08DRAFT_261367 [Xylaria arbuscula]
MCGDHSSRQATGGACAVLQPSPFPFHISPDLSARTKGRLQFFRGKTPDQPTTAVLVLESHEPRPSHTGPFWVQVYEEGDLTKPAGCLKPWAEFPVTTVLAESMQSIGVDGKPHEWSKELPPLKTEPRKLCGIEVGADGIIGRRVCVWRHNGVLGEPRRDDLAEGIVGHD